MSDLKAKPGQPVTAKKWNGVVDRLLESSEDAKQIDLVRLILCRTLEAIDGAVIDASDTADSVYSSGEVDTYGLVNNGDGTFSPGITNRKWILLNAASSSIPVDTELWAIEASTGVLVSTVWVC